MILRNIISGRVSASMQFIGICSKILTYGRQGNEYESREKSGYRYRKPWKAEDDGFTTREKADIMGHRQGQVFPVWRSLSFAAKSRKRWRSVSEMKEIEINGSKFNEE